MAPSIKLDESSAASVSLVEGLIILEQENKIKPQKFKSNGKLFEIFFKTKDDAEKIEGIPAVNLGKWIHRPASNET